MLARALYNARRGKGTPTWRCLRALWRVRGGDPRLADAAIELLDGLLARHPTPLDLMLRVEAALNANDSVAVRATADELRAVLQTAPENRALLQRLRSLLRQLPGEDATAEAGP